MKLIFNTCTSLFQLQEHESKSLREGPAQGVRLLDECFCLVEHPEVN